MPGTQKGPRGKGKRVERKAAAALNLELPGCNARRGQQHCGGPDSPDVATDIRQLHIEVKGGQTTPSLYGALNQSARESKPAEVPVALLKRDGEPFVVCCYLYDLRGLTGVLASFLAGQVDREDKLPGSDRRKA